jgi:hypothetical protein
MSSNHAAQAESSPLREKMEAHWESHYAQLKRDIQDARKSGKRCTETDIARFEDRYNKLDKSLQIIKSSPMEYEA